MAHAVDRQAILNTVYAGYAKPAASVLTRIAGDYLNAPIEPEAYDLAAANRILDEAGHARPARRGRIMEPYLVYVSKIPWDTFHRTEG